jgi:hypothetical protein
VQPHVADHHQIFNEIDAAWIQSTCLTQTVSHKICAAARTNFPLFTESKASRTADDLIIPTRGKSVSEVENTAKIELNKISKWAKDNKVRFNDQKSKVMLMTRQKRKERNDLEVHISKQQTPLTSKNHEVPGDNNRQQTNVQRTYYTCDRKMQKNNICFIKISKTKLGSRP